MFGSVKDVLVTWEGASYYLILWENVKIKIFSFESSSNGESFS